MFADFTSASFHASLCLSILPDSHISAAFYEATETVCVIWFPKVPQDDISEYNTLEYGSKMQR